MRLDRGDALVVLGAGCILGGVAWLSWPVALVLLGAVLVTAALAGVGARR